MKAWETRKEIFEKAGVTKYCLGTMTFGSPVKQEEATEIVRIAYDHGIRFIDTADIYPPGPGLTGISETMLGNALKGIREDVIVATKAGGPAGPGPQDKGLGKAHILESVDNSLKRMQTDYIDLFYAHFPDPEVTDEEFMETMAEVMETGKVRSYGISNFPAWRIAEMMHLAEVKGLPAPVMTESVYNLLTRAIEEELIPCCTNYGVGITCFNPLAGGMLTGKYLTKEGGRTGRLTVDKGYGARYGGEVNLKATERIVAMANEFGVTPAAFSIGWILKRKEIFSVILGASRKGQLLENLEQLEKTESIVYPEAELDEVWRDVSGNRFAYSR